MEQIKMYNDKTKQKHNTKMKSAKETTNIKSCIQTI